MRRARAFVAVVGLAVGCGGAAPRDLLMESVQTYNDGVRWQRFTAAAAVVPPAERDQFLDEREALADDLRITEYDIVRVASAGRRADVQVKVSWYLDSRGTVHDTWIRQRWEQQGRAWRVVEERRVRGEPMPGLPEPAPDSAGAADAATAAAAAGAPGALTAGADR